VRSRTPRRALPHRRSPPARRRGFPALSLLVPALLACGDPAVLGPADQAPNLDGGPGDALPAPRDAGSFALQPSSDEPLVLTTSSPRAFARFELDRDGGYRGTVQVTARDLPPGVTASVVRVPPALPGGVVALSLHDDGAPPAQGRFDDATLVAEPGGGGDPGLRQTAPLTLVLRDDPGEPDLTYGPAGDGPLTVDGGVDLDETTAGEAALLPAGGLLVPITGTDPGGDRVPALVRVTPDGRGLDPRFGDDGRLGPPTDADYVESLSVALEPAGETAIWVHETTWLHRALRVTLSAGTVTGNLGRDRTDVSASVGNARRVVFARGDGPTHAFIPSAIFVYARDDRMVRRDAWAEIGRYPATTEFFDPEVVAPLSDGGALVGGHDAKNESVEVHRLGPDGQLDRSYGQGGIANFGSRAAATLLALILGPDPGDDGAVPPTVVVTQDGDLWDAIRRLTPDGARDDGFGSSGRIERPPGLTGPVGGMVRDPDDGTLIAWFPGDDATPPRLARWSWDGSWDRGFGRGGVVRLDDDVGWRVTSVHPDPARDRILLVLAGDGAGQPHVRVRSIWR